MLVVIRCRVDDDDADSFLAEAMTVLDALTRQPGYVTGSVGRALDDPALWVLSTRWVGVGAYRRALSEYDVRVVATPLLSRALDEPSAYEILAGDGTTSANHPKPRGEADR